MKKIIGVLMMAVCLMMAAPAQAQFHFGVKGGLSLSKASLSMDALKSDNHTGWFIGPMAEFTVPLIGIGVDASALYSQTYVSTSSHSTNAKLQTVEIPINLKWSFGLGSLLGVYVAAGPQFGFNIGHKSFARYSLEKNTTSFNVGAGVKLIRHLQVGVNYNFALKDTGKATVNSEYVDMKNNNWQVSLAYLF